MYMYMYMYMYVCIYIYIYWVYIMYTHQLCLGEGEISHPQKPPRSDLRQLAAKDDDHVVPRCSGTGLGISSTDVGAENLLVLIWRCP